MNAVASAIYSTLSSGTALITALGGTAIYEMQAPDSASLPYVVFSKQGGGPININPSDMRDLIYYVRAYAASQKAAGTIDALIDALLNKRTLTVTNYTNYFTVREQDLDFVETRPSGLRVYSAGALYRIRIDS